MQVNIIAVNLKIKTWGKYSLFLVVVYSFNLQHKYYDYTQEKYK